jgi:hypothetical protein
MMAEAQPPIDEAMLSGFQALPEPELLGCIEVGYRPVEPTGTAECVRVLGRQCAQHRSIGQIAQKVSEALAPRVFEVEQLAALLEFEQLHGPAS